MATHAGHRSVQFAVEPQGAYAVHLRLTPGLLEALLAAQDAGQEASIRFGQGTEANVSERGSCRAAAASAAACQVGWRQSTRWVASLLAVDRTAVAPRLPSITCSL